MREWHRWLPGGLLAAGCLLNATLLARRATSTPLIAPIATVAVTSLGVPGTDIAISPEEQRVAGMTAFILRRYEPPGRPPYSIFVSYYDEQRQGKSIHSPKNCLPGAGWEPVDSKPMVLETTAGPVTVNRWRLVREGKTAIVYYWYQGRGRVAHDEFRVKFDLLRDAAVHGRTEEALVRIFVQIDGKDVDAADAVARDAARLLVADVNRILPPL
jgi:EpsI family protein